ncbi:MAG: Undecaprenyl-diphosphatase [Clostridiales bacterium 38_11]|nr:MAG: Undecaprenyl-diphosphatase [Clostridiales bacterium 38_11]HBH12881.1 undecaprenyl-diphosphatase [Clostridiales bacterium]
MTVFEGIFLGLTQGLTEFLPVSSSGHLAIMSKLFGIQEGNIFYSVMLHFSTLIAVLIYFRKDIIRLFFSLLSLIRKIAKMQNSKLALYERMVLLLLIATIPTVVIGLLFSDQFEFLYTDLRFVGFALIITGTLLLLSEKIGKRNLDLSNISFPKAILIGLFQGLAIAPGISRSGSTIVGALFVGLNREEAARFSFLLSIPAISGAALLEMLSINTANVVLNANLFLGMLTAFTAGMLSIGILMNLIRKGKLYYFSIYVFALGLFTIFFL